MNNFNVSEILAIENFIYNAFFRNSDLGSFLRGYSNRQHF